MAAGPRTNTARLKRGPAKSVGAGAMRVSSPSSLSGHFLVPFGAQCWEVELGQSQLPVLREFGVHLPDSGVRAQGAYPAVGVCPVSLIAWEELC